MTIFRDTVIDKWRVYGGYTNGSSISAVILRALLSTRTIAMTLPINAHFNHIVDRDLNRGLSDASPLSIRSFRSPISDPPIEADWFVHVLETREMRIRNGEETETIRFNTHTYISIEIYSIYALFNVISILYENEIFFKITRFPTNLIKSFELGARIKSRSLIRRESQLKLRRKPSRPTSSMTARQESFDRVKW